MPAHQLKAKKTRLANTDNAGVMQMNKLRTKEVQFMKVAYDDPEEPVSARLTCPAGLKLTAGSRVAHRWPQGHVHLSGAAFPRVQAPL